MILYLSYIGGLQIQPFFSWEEQVLVWAKLPASARDQTHAREVTGLEVINKPHNHGNG